MTLGCHLSSAVINLDECCPRQPDPCLWSEADQAWSEVSRWLEDDAAESNPHSSRHVEADLERLVIELEADWLLVAR
jgi:hypothetical protein